MAVYRLFRSRAFEPETISTMTRAHTEACRALGLNHRNHREAGASGCREGDRIRQRGERDPARLREHVLAALRT